MESRNKTFLIKKAIFCTISGTQNHRKENTNLLNTYVSSLTSLPESVRKCNLFLSFFEGPLSEVSGPIQMTDAATSPRSSLRQNNPVPVVQHLHNSGGTFFLHLSEFLLTLRTLESLIVLNPSKV